MGILVGATFLPLGLALRRAGMFAPWIRWTSVVAGAAGIVVGTLMMLQAAETFTFLSSRVAAGAVIIVALAMGIQVHRGTESVVIERRDVVA